MWTLYPSFLKESTLTGKTTWLKPWGVVSWHLLTSGGRQSLPAHSHSLPVWSPGLAKPENIQWRRLNSKVITSTAVRGVDCSRPMHNSREPDNFWQSWRILCHGSKWLVEWTSISCHPISFFASVAQWVKIRITSFANIYQVREFVFVWMNPVVDIM